MRRRWGSYELVDHWQQGEFHHDVVVRVPRAKPDLGADILVVATNCNGGVKEIFCFDQVPDRSALWHYRCPQSPEFGGEETATSPYPATGHSLPETERGRG